MKTTEEKISSLEEEIKELKEKDADKEKLKKLFDERNKLKFKKLYGIMEGLKSLGRGIADWADKKNKELEEQEKHLEKEEPIDVYDALFGKPDLDMGI